MRGRLRTRFVSFLVLWVGVGVAAGMTSQGCTTDPAVPASSDAGLEGTVRAPDAELPPDFGAPSDTYPATKPPPFPIVRTHGNQLLTKDITVVPVVYSGDTGAANVSDFLKRYAASAEWTASVAEYGVGAMTVAPTV